MKLGAVKEKLALSQHAFFKETLESLGAEVLEMPFVHGAYDSVFAKDSAVLRQSGSERHAYLANPRHQMRQKETLDRELVLESLGFRFLGRSEKIFEGGDLLMLPGHRRGFLGYGFRSDRAAAKGLEDFLNSEIVPLELRDPYFYHLDTALALTSVDTAHSHSSETVAFAYPEAFTKSSWQRLLADPDIGRVIPVSREAAMLFGLNWVEVGGSVLLGRWVPSIATALRSLGKVPVLTPLDQFQLAGGSSACLTLPLHQLDCDYTCKRSRLTKTAPVLGALQASC